VKCRGVAALLARAETDAVAAAERRVTIAARPRQRCRSFESRSWRPWKRRWAVPFAAANQASPGEIAHETADAEILRRAIPAMAHAVGQTPEFVGADGDAEFAPWQIGATM